MISKKAQASFEIFLLLGFMFLIFTAFAGAIMNRMVEVTKHQDRQLLIDLGKRIQSEVNLASTASPGYQRTFLLPATLNGREYKFNSESNKIKSDINEPFNHLAIKYATSVNHEEETEYVASIPLNVNLPTDGPNKGANCITKDDVKVNFINNDCPDLS